MNFTQNVPFYFRALNYLLDDKRLNTLARFMLNSIKKNL